jgi:hypothetical protein
MAVVCGHERQRRSGLEKLLTRWLVSLIHFRRDDCSNAWGSLLEPFYKLRSRNFVESNEEAVEVSVTCPSDSL